MIQHAFQRDCIPVAFIAACGYSYSVRLVTLVDRLLRLIYELHFITRTCTEEKQYTQSLALSVVSGIHGLSGHVPCGQGGATVGLFFS